MRYLVIHDVDAIQKYVFATNRLREIRGSSALIDRINRRDTLDLVNRYGGQLIYSGGGGMAADFATPNAASGLCRDLGARYVDGTISSSSTGVIESYDENAPDNDEQGFANALKRARGNLRREKGSRARASQVLTNPYAKRCQACGIYPADHYDEKLPGTEQTGKFICVSCYRKRRHAGRAQLSRVHQRIRQEIISQGGPRVRFPRELDEDIGDGANPPGYIGVIYADGNRIGDWLRRIKSKTALRDFSQTVDDATTQAISSVLARRWREHWHGQQVLPALVPLCGGDDLVVVVRGEHALAIAIEYLQQFQKRAQMPPAVVNEIDNNEVSACAGVAIGKSHVPLSALFGLAHELCGLAKQRHYDLFQGQQGEVSCIDFQVVTTPNWGDVEVARREQLQPREDCRLTCRPYTLSEAEGLVKAVRELKTSKLPSGKLHDLYRSLWLGRYQATQKYLMTFVRARESAMGPRQQSALRQAQAHLGVVTPPWKPGETAKWETPYADLVEIYQFVGE